MRHKYSIGLDFGTLTARAVIVDVETGRELATSTFGYQDAIIDTVLPETGIHLPADFALQNPRDYQEAVVSLLRDITVSRASAFRPAAPSRASNYPFRGRKDPVCRKAD